MNYGKLSEKLKIDSEVLSLTSAAAAVSQNYDMSKYTDAYIVVNVEGNAAGGVTIDLTESSNATAAGTTAAGSKTGIVVGGTAATNIAAGSGVRDLTLTFSSASTDGNFFTLSVGTVSKKFTYTTSTAAWASGSTLQYATNINFGTTVGSTVNTGIAGSIDSLKTGLQSTLGFGTGVLTLTTPTTDSIRIQLMDDAVGDIGLNASAVMSAVVNNAVGAFDIKADQLTSTASKRYLGVKVSTAATSCRAAITVIRTGGRYMPPAFKGKLSS